MTNDEIDEDWICWKDLVLSVIDQHIPRSKIRDTNAPSWIDGEVISLFVQKERISKKKGDQCQYTATLGQI